MPKPKLGLYWAASCGGCEIAVLDTELKVLEIADFFDIVFWPCAMDFKYDDVRALADGEITLTLFNGAIRSSENYEMAKLMRAKSTVLCAFGSCAADGCIPGLANFTSLEAIERYVYDGRNQFGTFPRERSGCRSCGTPFAPCRKWWTSTTSSPAARRSRTRSRRWSTRSWIS
jgi:coenzyme F420-reducing hydrogenase gamma subunit